MISESWIFWVISVVLVTGTPGSGSKFVLSGTTTKGPGGELRGNARIRLDKISDGFMIGAAHLLSLKTLRANS